MTEENTEVQETEVQETEVQETEGDQDTFDESDLMTPEEMVMLKKLTEKRKSQQKAMSGIKDNLFQTLTGAFGAAFSKVKKDVVTVSTKEKMPDGNIYSITFGVEADDKDGVDTNALAISVIEGHLDVIEPIMGISNSLKVDGTYEGKKLFWQIRKRV